MTTTIAPVAPVATARSASSRNKNRFVGVAFVAFGLLLWWLAVPNVTDEERTFAFERPPDPIGWSFHAATVIGVIATIYIILGLMRVFSDRVSQKLLRSNRVVAVVLLVPLLLTLAMGRSDKSFTNVTNLAQQSLFLATPIALGAMTGLWSERVGIINIGIEGMMLTSAGVGFMSYVLLGDAVEPWALWVAILIAVLTGALVAALLGVLSIHLSINQIIAGVVINLLALGLTGFLRSQVIVPSGVSGGVSTPGFSIPILSSIPVIGPELFVAKPIYLMMFFVVIGTWVVMYRTAWGMRVRACGEDPYAAEAVGINVIRTRYIAVLIGGAIAGLAGAWVSMEPAAGFEDAMTANRGFIALAALIFGRWRPGGAFAGALLFGFSSSLQSRLQTLQVDIGGFAIPSAFWQMLPYLITIVVVAGLVGRAVPPAAEGEPYSPSK